MVQKNNSVLNGNKEAKKAKPRERKRRGMPATEEELKQKESLEQEDESTNSIEGNAEEITKTKEDKTEREAIENTEVTQQVHEIPEESPISFPEQSNVVANEQSSPTVDNQATVAEDVQPTPPVSQQQPETKATNQPEGKDKRKQVKISPFLMEKIKTLMMIKGQTFYYEVIDEVIAAYVENGLTETEKSEFAMLMKIVERQFEKKGISTEN